MTLRSAERSVPVVVLRRAAAQDERLSYRARGILADAKSRPPDWRFDAVSIARRAREGEHAVRTALRELEQFGYLRRDRVRLPNGRLMTTWAMTDDPTTEPTGRRFPPVGSPPVGSPPPGAPPSRKPPVLLRRETEVTTPPPTPAGPPKAERVKALGVVVVEGLKGRAPTPGRGTLLVACDRLADEGWSPDELGTAVAGHDWTGAGAGAVIAYLRGLTAADRRPLAQKPAQERPAWCGACDEPSRLLLDDQGRPRRGQHCPDCHPKTARRTTT